MENLELVKCKDLAYKYKVHGMVNEYDYLKVMNVVEFYADYLGTVLHSGYNGFDFRTSFGVFKVDRKRLLKSIKRMILLDDFRRNIDELNMLIDTYNNNVLSYNNISWRSGKFLPLINCYELNKVSERDIRNQKLVEGTLRSLIADMDSGVSVGKLVTVLQYPYIGKLGMIKRTTKAFASIIVLEDMVEILVRNKNFVDYFDFVTNE